MKVSGEIGDGVDLPAHGPWPAAQLVPVKVDNGVTLLLLACPALYQRAGGPYVDAQRPRLPRQRLALRPALRAWPRSWARCIRRCAAGWPTWCMPTTGPAALAPLYLAQARRWRRTSQRPPACSPSTTWPSRACSPWTAPTCWACRTHWRGIDGVEFWGQLSMLKAGLQFADAITTVSPTYAREIQTPGARRRLRRRAARARGAPARHPERHRHDGLGPGARPAAAAPLQRATTCRARRRARRRCRRACGLPADAGAMLFARGEPAHAAEGHRPGAGGAAAAAGRRARSWWCWARASRRCSRRLRDAAQQHPKQVAVTLGFDEGLAHLIEAGADAFLMPSRFEPCGLNQMYSQAYGTPPIVAPVGGLLDSVTDASADPAHGTGFVMTSADCAGLEDALARAQRAWREPQRWRAHPGQRHGAPLRLGGQRDAVPGGVPSAPRSRPEPRSATPVPASRNALAEQQHSSACARRHVVAQEIQKAPHRRHHAAARGKHGLHLIAGGAQPGSTGTSSPRAQFVAAHVVGQHAHARALQHRVLQRQQVVGRVARAGAAARTRARAGPAGCQLARPSAADIATVGRLLQVLRRLAAAPQRCSSCRAGHQQRRSVLPRFLTTRLPLSSSVGAHAQRDVDAFLHQVHHAVGHLHVDAHLRMALPGTAAAAARWWSAPASPGKSRAWCRAARSAPAPRPRRPPRPARASRRSGGGRARRPAVSDSLRVVRCSSRTPSRASSSATRRDSLDLGRPSARPAAAKPPRSTTSAK